VLLSVAAHAGIKSKDDVIAMGIDKYNEACRSIVMRYSKARRAAGASTHARTRTRRRSAVQGFDARRARTLFVSLSRASHQEWETTVRRVGRWIDFENDYKTLDPEFMARGRCMHPHSCALICRLAALMCVCSAVLRTARHA
jgi:hypothetical protein